MPHPKNRLKLTGDTHLPVPGDLLEQDDEMELAAVDIDNPPRVYADGWVPPAQQAMRDLEEEKHQALPQPLVQLERKVEQKVASTPWLAVGAALGFGLLVAKMLRR
jgi:hypothetical protein